jgi:hypothetical protein
MSSFTPEGAPVPAYDPDWDVRRRPTAVLVLAILHLVGGGLGLVLALCSGAFLLATDGGASPLFSPGPNPPPQVRSQQEYQKRLAQHMAQEVPFQKPLSYANVALDVVLDVLLVAAGVGLLSLRPWARTASMAYAVLSLLLKAVGVVALAFTWPVMTEFTRQEAQRDPNLAMVASLQPVILFTSAATLVVLAAYPVAVLIVLTRPSVVAAFRPAPAEPPGPERRAGEGPAGGDITTD